HPGHGAGHPCALLSAYPSRRWLYLSSRKEGGASSPGLKPRGFRAAPLMIHEENSPNIVLRFLWFILVGWWLGFVVTSVAFFFEATIIGIPLALYLFHRTPAIMTLKARSSKVAVYRDAQGQLLGQEVRPEQYNLGLRILYFLFIGWWLTG